MQTSFLYTALPGLLVDRAPSKNATKQLHREEFTVSYHVMQIKLINDYLDMTYSAILSLFSDCHLPSVWMECPWSWGGGNGPGKQQSRALTLDNYRY